MKRAILISLIVLLAVITMTTCGPTPTVTPITPTISPTPTVTPKTEPPLVVIFVIDEFAFTLPITNTQEGATCIISFNEQGVYATEGAGKCSDLLHGPTVYAEFEAQMKAYGYVFDIDLLPIIYPDAPTPTSAHPIMDLPNPVRSMNLWRRNRDMILLVAIDTSGFRTEVITERIISVHRIVAETPPDAIRQVYLRGVVVNMSFALVPCQGLIDLGLTEEQYEDLLNVQEVIDLASALSSDPNGFSSLETRLQEISEIPIIQIAAAGNSGLSFPFAPASWPSTVGVSASDARCKPHERFCLQGKDCDFCDCANYSCYACDCNVCDSGTCKANYSNYGEIMMDGMHTDPAFVCDALTGSPRMIGTSYAAPKLSVQAALCLLRAQNAQDADNCRCIYNEQQSENTNWANLALESSRQGYDCSLQPISTRTP